MRRLRRTDDDDPMTRRALHIVIVASLLAACQFGDATEQSVVRSPTSSIPEPLAATPTPPPTPTAVERPTPTASPTHHSKVCCGTKSPSS